MALEWLLPMLVKAGMDVGVRSVQKWQQGRYLDLSTGGLGSNVTISVSLPPHIPFLRDRVLLLALEREDGWHHALYAEPLEKFRLRVERGVYVLSALALGVPRDPDRKKALLGLVRERRSIATASKQLTLSPTTPTVDAVKRAGLVLADGSIPFEIWRGPPRARTMRVTADALEKGRPMPSRGSTPDVWTDEFRSRLRSVPPTPVQPLPAVVGRRTQNSPRDDSSSERGNIAKSRAKKGDDAKRRAGGRRADPAARFIKEITKRGFRLGPSAKYVYYHRTDSYPEQRRIVVRGSRVRFEKQERYEWKLWKSYGLAYEFEAALEALEQPGNGFARRSWVQAAG